MDTPSLAKVIEDTIDAKLLDLHTCMPAKVVKVDVTKAQCDVQPLFKRKYGDGEIVKLPVITNVPISFYRAGKCFISLPVHVGDLVELRFAERSLDVWLSKGGEIEPIDYRKFDLSDAVAYPGLYPFTDPPVGATANDLIIKNDTTVITVKPSGEVEVQASSAIKLLSNLIELSGNSDAIALASKVMTELQKIQTWAASHTHVYSAGPTPGAITAPAAPVLAAPLAVASTKVKAV